MRIFRCRTEDGERSRTFLITTHIIGGVFLAGLLGLALGWFVTLLWNGLMPDLFSLPRISYWQGVGMLLLGRLLTGGFGHGRGMHGHPFRRRWDSPRRDYDAWWREVGECSFRQYAGENGKTDDNRK